MAFSWPVLSIPQAGGALLWLFAAWGAGIGLLLVCARLTLRYNSDDDADATPGMPSGDASPIAPHPGGMASADNPSDKDAGGPGDD